MVPPVACIQSHPDTVIGMLPCPTPPGDPQATREQEDTAAPEKPVTARPKAVGRMELPELVWVRLCTSTYGMAVFAMSHDGRVGQSSSDPFGATQFGRAVARPHRPVSYVALNVVLNAAALSL